MASFSHSLINPSAIQMKKFAAFILLLLPSLLLAQEYFTPGYVVLQNGDTVQGQVDFRDWKKNPTKIHFQPAGKPTVSYSADELQAFYVEDGGGHLYESHRVEIDKSPHLTFQLNKTPDAQTETETLFLYVYLKDRPISLFYYYDSIKKPHFFIQQGEQRPEELINRKYKVNIEGKEFVKHVDKYKGQLTHLLADCPEIKVPQRTLPYKKNTLIALINRYNRCKNADQAPLHYHRPDRTKFKLGVMAGITGSNINFKGEYHPTLVGATFYMKPSPAAGINLNVLFPHLHYSISLYNELAYRPLKISGENIKENKHALRNTVTSNQFILNRHQLKSSHLIRWQQPNKENQLFFQGGIWASFNILTGVNERIVATSFQEPNELIASSKQIWVEPVAKFDYGYAAGFGCMHKQRLSLELRAEVNRGLMNLLYLNSKTYTFGLFAGYTF